MKCGCGLELSSPLPVYDVAVVLGGAHFHLLPALGEALKRTNEPELEILCLDSTLIVSRPLESVTLAEVLRTIYRFMLCPTCLDVAVGAHWLAHDGLTPDHLFSS